MRRFLPIAKARGIHAATLMTDFTRLRPHWRPSHQADPIGFDRWIGPDGANGWVKILNPDGHLCRQVWSVAPYARLCLRLHLLSEQQAELLSDPFGLGIAHADQWQRWLSDQGVDANRVACEGINEAALWNPGVIQAHNIYAGSFGKAMRERGLTAVIGNINTGWPGNTGPDTPVNWNPLLPTLHAIRMYGHFLGLHEYVDGRGPVADWGWNMGRFTQLPREFAGLPILFTEVGYDRAVNAPSGTGNHGWQGELSIDTYMEYLTEYDRRLRAYPNALAAFIFTHDFDAPWGTWDTVPLLDRLCGHAEWVRSQAVPTPPETPATVPPATIHLPNVGTSPTPPTAAPTEPQPPQPTPYPTGIIDPRALAAILQVESGGTGFRNGRLLIRFEAHIFRSQLGNDPLFAQHFRYSETGAAWTGQQWRMGPSDAWRMLHTGNQDDEWAAFNQALELDAGAAMRSISMGAPQVMGFNHARIGYPTAAAMFEAFQDSLAAQLIGLINFVLSDPALADAIRRKDWRGVAKLYNGSGAIDVYAPLLEAAYSEATRAA